LTLTAEVVLDKRSATAAADEAQRAWADAGRNIQRDFNQSMSGMNTREQFRRVGRESSAALRDELRSGLNNVVSDVTRQFGAMGQVAESTFAAMPRGAAMAAVGVAGIGLAAVAVGKQFYDLGAKWDDIADGITLRTGKVGDSLTALTDAVGDIGSATAADLGSIGDIVGQLSQSMPGIAANSSVLRQMGSNLAYLDANGQAVDIRELGMAFNAFGVDSSHAVTSLDDLVRVSQATGIPINELISTVRNGAPQFKQFGLDLGEATGLMSSFSRAGIDPGVTVAGLRLALKNLGDDARGAAPALADTITQIKALYDAGQSGAAQTLASDTFGSKTFTPFLDAIENGTLDANNLKTALDNVGLSVAELQDATDDGAQGFQKLWNTIQTEAAPVANKFFTFLNNEVQYLTGNLTDAGDKLKDVASTPIDPNSALGKILTSGGVAIPGTGGPGVGVALPTGIGSGISPIPSSGMLGPNGLLAPNWGTNPVSAPPSSKSSSGAKLPDAPVLPYDTSLPGGIGNLPQTSALYSAESGFLDARHKAAEKQARLNQLEQSNVATERDIQDARNEAIQATRSQNEAEARMWDAATKKAKDQASAMEEVGAQLDQDFGVSKGLAGIAENLTKFLANLAFAPVFGALEAVKKSEGFDKDSGSGIVGMLGNQGAFGPQFTPQARAAANGSSSPALVPMAAPGGAPGGAPGAAYPGDAALLANVPAGRYSQTGNADLVKGLGDCSSAVEDLVNIMDGRPTGGRSMATGNAAEWLTEHGFQPGMGGPGDFRVGYNSGHMQATLPGGTPFNWGSDASAAQGGVGGTGAFDPAFTDHYYRPAAGNPSWSGSPGVGGLPGGGGGQGPIFGVSSGPGVGSGVSPGGGGTPGVGYDPMALLPGASVPGQAGGNPLGGLAGGPGGAPGGGFGWGRGVVPGVANQGAAPSQSVAGGRQFGQGLPASGGISFNGGIIGAAASMAAGAAGGAASFGAGGGAASAAADIGMQLIGRAIGAGGQYAGNAVTGLMETFALNDSALADPGKSWLGRLGIAAAGMRPALPNTAGALGGEQNAAMAEGGKPQPPGPLTPQEASEKQAADAKGGGDGKPGDTTNITVNNQRATEDGTGRDIQASLGANQSSKQPR
jgi:hypothetical protein